jgi:2-methylcitrate dehydratase PrpD
MSYSRQLAQYIAGLEFDALQESTVTKTEHCFTDWLAAVFNSYTNNLSSSYIDFATRMGGDGTGTIIGSEQRTALPWAAFANACLGHITEVDDGHRMSIMHIGTVVLPVVFAYAEKLSSSGKDMIEAAVCGYDLAIRVGECLGKDHYTIWHTTATAGTFGAAAAAAKMLKLSEEEIVWTLGHAGTQAAGLWQFLLDGSVKAKAFHPGKAVFNGILAAELAAQGIEGPEHIFEGEKGFCRSASPDFDLSYLTDRLGSHFKVDEVNFKGYPTCGQTHSMIDAVKKIMENRELKPEEIEKIEAHVYRKAIDVAGITDPTSLEEAKFSNPFCMATLITKKEITFTNISAKDLENRTIRDLMTKVKLIFDPELEKLFPACRPCRISVTLKDGTTLTAENRFRKGDPENPMDRASMADKFTELTSPVIGEDVRKRVLDWVYGLDQLKNYKEL